MSPEAVIESHIILSVAFLALSLLVIRMSRTLEKRLLALGVIFVAAAMSFASIQAGSPQAAVLFQGMPSTLMRLAVLLVLAGIVVSVAGVKSVIAEAAAPEKNSNVA